jgi:hypothetical protein
MMFWPLLVKDREEVGALKFVVQEKEGEGLSFVELEKVLGEEKVRNTAQIQTEPVPLREVQVEQQN